MNDQEDGLRAQSEETNAPNAARLFGQMLMLPATIFVQAMELFLNAMRGMQKAADNGMDAMVGDATQKNASLGTPQEWPANGEAVNSGHQTPGFDGGLRISVAETTNPQTGSNTAETVETNQKETRKMNDTNLSDDMLKLVRYKILFVKRDYEVAFPEREELVYDNMTDDAFTAWKVAEFIQRLGKEEVPLKWIEKSYPPGRVYSQAEKDALAKAYIGNMREDDKKYLRVFFEVMQRYEREEANYDRDQIDVLKQIRDRI